MLDKGADWYYNIELKQHILIWIEVQYKSQKCKYSALLNSSKIHHFSKCTHIQYMVPSHLNTLLHPQKIIQSELFRISQFHRRMTCTEAQCHWRCLTLSIVIHSWRCRSLWLNKETCLRVITERRRRWEVRGKGIRMKGGWCCFCCVELHEWYSIHAAALWGWHHIAGFY